MTTDTVRISQSRRLLFVVNIDWFFVSHRLPIALEAIEQGYEVHIAAALTGRRAELERQGLIVHALKLERGSTNIGGQIVSFRQILKLFRTIRPDIVHLVTIKPVLLGGLAARIAGVPAVVAAISGLGSVFVAQGGKAALRRRLAGWLYRAAFKHKNLKVIFQNPSDKALLSDLTDLSKNRTAMIRGSGIDLEVYKARPLPEGTPVVMLAARLLYDKGVREFVEAARLLRRDETGAAVKACFVLAGNPDPDNPASIDETELDKWQKSGLVKCWGHRSDMPEALAEAHIVVLPSYREGLPKILLEAAACSRAVVTTDVPGCRDAIKADVTGILVPVRDAIALAEAIKKLLNDPGRYAVMGQAGRVLAEQNFDIRQVVEKHMEIYNELISGK